MKANVGNLDKIIRIIAGIGLFSLFFILEGNLRFLGLIGIVPIATALIGWCPLYSVIGVSTCPLTGKKTS
ncbi:MAG: DUF2892 domain-containing protein [Burkholderiales bacterium]|nr:DUF2892 domain-containing protein [Burkholderiales bacterium]